MTLKDVAGAVRTRQWAKNALIFAGFLFADRLRQPAPQIFAEAGRVLLAFFCFCALSGIAYIVNDWRDIESDRRHPKKSLRPLAAGRISLRQAAGLMAALLAFAVLVTVLIGLLAPEAWGFAPAAVAYLALTLAYSFWLKHEVIIDVLCLATGFVLRVVAGCVALPVTISPWIIFCTFNLALFVSLCKRRAELVDLGEASGTRHVLSGYNLPLLDTFIAIAACLTIAAYSLYTFNAPHLGALGEMWGKTPLLMTSIPFVVYGVFRYLWLAHSSSVGGEPEQMLKDRPLMINSALWLFWIVLLSLINFKS